MKSKTSLLLLISLVIAGVAAVGPMPRQPSKSDQNSHAEGQHQEPKIQTNVREVLVPVVVTDKKGHYISDLKAADFTLTEDGVQQKIIALTTASDSPVALATGATPDKAQASSETDTANLAHTPLQRTYWICIDTLHSSFANFNRVRDALEKFFQQEGDSDSKYALVVIGREVNVIQDSTSERALILGAIQKGRLAKSIVESEASNTANDAKQFTEAVWQYCNACGSCSMAAKGDPAWCSTRMRQVQVLLAQFEKRWLMVNQEFLKQLTALASQMAKIPPTRTIIFVSDGFNRVPGRELYAILQGFGVRDRSFGFSPENTGAELDSLLKVAVGSDTRFYTLDSKGLYTQADMTVSSADASRGRINPPPGLEPQASIVAHENTDALAELAHRTGGLFFENSNDLLKGVRKAYADGREYYVLSYVPTNDLYDGAFRRINLEVTGRKLVITAKAGYWAAKN